MKNLFFLIMSILPVLGIGQIDRSILRGTYNHTTGGGFSWIHDEDGSSMEVSNPILSNEVMKLKRFGRMTITDEEAIPLFTTGKPAVFKGKWRIEGDSIHITYKEFQQEVNRSFTFREPAYLEAADGGVSYQKVFGKE